MRDGVTVRSHEDLVPYMTQNRHMTCVHAASQLGCLDCLKFMVSLWFIREALCLKAKVLATGAEGPELYYVRDLFKNSLC